MTNDPGSTATDVLMPRLSDAMAEGTIVKWLVQDGATVAAGDELVEIETDKATMAHEAEAGGTVEIVRPEGDTVAVGEVIARVGAAVDGAAVAGDGSSGGAATIADGDVTAAGDAAASAAGGAAGEAPREVAADGAAARDVTSGPGVPDAPGRVAAAASAGSSANGAAAAGKRASAGEASPSAAGESPAATPVARRYAEVHGVALAEVPGSGPRGRIVKHDVLRAAGVESAPEGARPIPARTSAPAAAPETAGARPDAETRREPTRLQATIARRMAEANATVPHFQVQTEAEMTEALALRAKLASLVAEGERPPSLNDLVVRACAVALREHPLANGSWVEDAFELHEDVHVGIAVATEGGLVVPVLRHADRLSLGGIAAESRRLAGRVRSGEVSAAELTGGTFTVSNLGMYGMTAITPVVNPPQAAILGVGAVREILARVDGEVVDRPLMTLTLSCDHRILYGADAALFLRRVRELLEQPLRIAL